MYVINMYFHTCTYICVSILLYKTEEFKYINVHVYACFRISHLFRMDAPQEGNVDAESCNEIEDDKSISDCQSM